MIFKSERTWVALAVSACLLAGLWTWIRRIETQGPGVESLTNFYSPEELAAHQRALEEAVDSGDKEYQARMRNPPTNQMRLPNFETGPGRPLPDYVNFYSMDERFTSYLLCEYPVRVETYNQSSELDWFKASLLQIRQLGPKKFPPIKWIAVIVNNGAEHKGASTFEQSFKVGAIFQATNVFDSLADLSQLISQSNLDRHPFKYDLQQETPGAQQRWVIVERHATTNHSDSYPSHP